MSTHGCGFEVVERDENHKATVWLASCKCKERWTGGTYEEAEDKWRQHVHGIRGSAPEPAGSLVGRWTP